MEENQFPKPLSLIPGVTIHMGRGKRSRIAERNEGEAERMRNNDEWFTELNVMVLLQVVLLLPTVLLILAASHTHTQHSCTHPWRNPLQDLRPTQIHSTRAGPTDSGPLPRPMSFTILLFVSVSTAANSYEWRSSYFRI
jgi:hypothetical protein